MDKQTETGLYMTTRCDTGSIMSIRYNGQPYGIGQIDQIILLMLGDIQCKLSQIEEKLK